VSVILANVNKKAELPQRWPRYAPYIWVPWIFSRVPETEYTHGYFYRNFSWAFVPIDPMNMHTKFEVRSFTRSWDSWGYLKTLGSPRICPRSFFPKFLMGFIRMDPLNVPEICSFTRSWDNSNWSFEWGLRTLANSWGRGGRRESGMVPFERALVSSYRPFTVTFPLSLRVSEILSLLWSSTPLLPHP